jgi:hypothetical protein
VCFMTIIVMVECFEFMKNNIHLLLIVQRFRAFIFRGDITSNIISLGIHTLSPTFKSTFLHVGIDMYPQRGSVFCRLSSYSPKDNNLHKIRPAGLEKVFQDPQQRSKISRAENRVHLDHVRAHLLGYSTCKQMTRVTHTTRQ